MNKWIRRALKLLVFFILWFVITATAGILNKDGSLSSIPIPPIFLFASFAVPGFLCYSKWANKEFWKKY